MWIQALLEPGELLFRADVEVELNDVCARFDKELLELSNRS